MAKSRNRPNHRRRVEKRKAMQQFNRDYRIARAEAVRARLILLAVLGQSGGEVTVTAGTLQQIGSRIDHFDYQIVDGVSPGESIVKLIEDKSDEQSAEAVAPEQDHDEDRGARGNGEGSVTITRIDEDETGLPAGAPDAAGERRDDASDGGADVQPAE